MLSNRPAPAPLAVTGTSLGARVPPIWRSVVAFVSVAAVLYLVMGAVAPHLPEASGPRLAPPFTGPAWLEGWAQWDSGWYERIASEGYSFVAGRQSTVAFFPAYPLTMRVAGTAIGDMNVAGIVVTFLAGMAGAALFFAWVRARLAPVAAWTALAAFLLFPYAFYLYGVVYADALFIAALLGAFLLLEDDRPVLAGLAGAVATAARPVGVVLVVALVVRAVERRGGLWQARPGPERPPERGAGPEVPELA
jgi:Gpi18-like mannosyltransferase